MVFVLVFATLWGCLEYNITTQVMPDGKILRTVTVKGDSADIFTGSFRVPSDSSWGISTRREPRSDKDIHEDKIYVYEATKEFEDFQDLNRTFYKDTSFNDHISINVDLETKSRWFYKYYYYTETYSMLFPFRSEPVTKYLKDDELRILLADEKEICYFPQQDRILLVKDTLNLPLLSGKDSLRFKELREIIENKFESWQRINIYNDFYVLVTASLEKLGIEADTSATRDPFFHWLDSLKTVETGIENSEAFINAAADYFKIETDKLKAADPKGFDSFNKKFRVATYSLETYKDRVLMPGMIVNSNADEVDINTAIWTFKTENFYATDYEMTVESRIVNRWFVVGAGLLLVILLGLVLVPVFKK